MRGGKGKARTRYEFGCKTSIATTNERTKGGQFVLGAMALPGNPYDGHSLAGQIDRGFSDAIDMILRARGRVVFCGMGKSGLIARKLAATFSSTGTPSRCASA